MRHRSAGRVAVWALAAAVAAGGAACGRTGEPAVSGGGPPAPLPAEPAAHLDEGVARRAADRPASTGGYLGVILPGEEVEVVSETGGRVRRVAVRPGDPVSEGALLATVVLDGLQDEQRIEEAGLAAAGARLAELEIEVRRAEREQQRRLALGDLMSRQEVDAAAFELQAAERRRDAARAEVERVRARLARLRRQAGRSEVRAPFSGTVAVRHADPGAVIAAGAPVVRLIGEGERLVRFAVPPDEIGALHPGQALSVTLESTPVVRRATLARVAPEIDAPSQLVFVEARLDAAAGPDPGLAAGAIVRVSPAGATP